MKMAADILSLASVRVAAGFDQAACSASWHVLDLETGSELGVESNFPVVLASVFKVQVALEFYAQVDEGLLSPAQLMTLEPGSFTAGPTGISGFEDPVRISLRDLCKMMMSVSDNTATDVLLGLVGIDRINARTKACGCNDTHLQTNLKDLFDEMALEIGFANYAELFAAQSGNRGPDAGARSRDPKRIDACSAFDPGLTNRSTPRDMTRLLEAIWKDKAASAASCARTRAVMAQQVSSRIGRALPDGAILAEKTGRLSGRVRNEVGVITHADGRAYAVAVFTRAHTPFANGSAIETEIAKGVATAIAALRQVAY